MGFNVATAFEQFCSNLRFSDADASTISNRYTVPPKPTLSCLLPDMTSRELPLME